MVRLNKEILRLAIPNILTNISVPLLSTVDTILMGHFSAIHLGAVGLGSMIFNFLYWNFGFLRMGTVGITAQAYGAKNQPGMIHTVIRAMILAFFISLILLILQWPIREVMVYLMQATPELTPLINQYFNVRIWAAPATLGLYGLFGFFFGMQNVMIPMVLTILINVVNIILSYVLIYRFGMDVAGVAWGTVIAQYFGLIIGLALFQKKYAYLWAAFRKKIAFDLAPLKEFFRINRDIFIRTLSLSSTFFFFYSQSAKISPIALAANVVLLQYVNWMSFGVDGFAYATEALVGKYKGAGENNILRKTIRYSMYWGMGLAGLFSFFYLGFGDWLLWVFTDSRPVIAFAKPLLFWVILFPIIGTPSYIWDGVYIGLTASRSMRNTMLLAFLAFLLTYYLSVDIIGVHSLWLALSVFLGLRGLAQAWLFRRHGLDLK